MGGTPRGGWAYPEDRRTVKSQKLRIRTLGVRQPCCNDHTFLLGVVVCVDVLASQNSHDWAASTSRRGQKLPWLSLHNNSLRQYHIWQQCLLLPASPLVRCPRLTLKSLTHAPPLLFHVFVRHVTFPTAGHIFCFCVVSFHLVVVLVPRHGDLIPAPLNIFHMHEGACEAMETHIFVFFVYFLLFP